MITIKQSKGMDLLNRLIKFVVVFYIKIRMSFEILSLYAKRFNGVYVVYEYIQYLVLFAEEYRLSFVGSTR